MLSRCQYRSTSFFLIIGGCNAHSLLENAVEMVGVLESGDLGNAVDLHFGIHQQRAADVEARFAQDLRECKTRRVADEFADVRHGVMEIIGKFFKSDRTEIVVDEIEYLGYLLTSEQFDRRQVIF